MTIFDGIAELPADPIFGLTALYNEDARDDKINLSVGTYRSEDLKLYRMECVHKAETDLLDTEPQKNYLPIDGNRTFLDESGKLIFGEELYLANMERIASVQTLGGTGALRVGADFIVDEINSHIHLPNITWPNHLGIFKRAHFEECVYPYINLQSMKLEFDEMYDAMESVAPHHVVLLQPVCHNPTGLDLTMAQWKALSDLMLKKQLIPFFDFAYHGFKEGLVEDGGPIKLFLEAGHLMFISYTYSKSMGLYGERAGGLFVVTRNGKERKSVQSVLKSIIRTSYSNPPRHGAAIVQRVLTTTSLRELWIEELASARSRANKMRKALRKEISESKIDRQFHSLDNGFGFFALLGLSRGENEAMMNDHGIYMTARGRVNLCGFNQEIIPQFVSALEIVCQK